MQYSFTTPEAALSVISPGDRVFLHGGAATPLLLINKLFENASDFRDVELVSLSMYGNINWDVPTVKENFYLNSLFISANVREWVNGPTGDYVPVFLSEIPGLFERGILPLNVAVVQVSPPDDNGYCTLGTSVDAAFAAVKYACKVVALVNPRMPRTFGDGVVHFSRFAAAVWHEANLPEIIYQEKADKVTEQIGYHVASLIDDGATLEMGIGAIPDAVLGYLTGHKQLGIHTEMLSDGIIPLLEKGVVTNERKTIHPCKTVTSFILGTQKLYDFANNNKDLLCLDVSFVNDASVIRQNPGVTAINSAIEVDLTGQVCADSIGMYQYSGIGGQMDFMRGAALSHRGKPIIALPSTTRTGISRIVPFLKQGAGVVTTRGDVHYVVTEYGIVNLYGKNMEQRAKLLTSIAHPAHREQLERACFDRFGKLMSQH